MGGVGVCVHVHCNCIELFSFLICSLVDLVAERSDVVFVRRWVVIFFVENEMFGDCEVTGIGVPHPKVEKQLKYNLTNVENVSPLFI